MKARKLRTKILAFALPLTLIPFVATALAVYYFVIRSYQQQIEEEQKRLLAEAVVNIRREQEAARRDIALMAGLPAVAEYLEAASARPQTTASERELSGQAKETTAHTILQLFFNQNPYYFQLILVDAQGQERIKLSKLPESASLGTIKGKDVFKRMLIGGYRGATVQEIQLPVVQVQANRFASVFAHQVRRERFAGMAVLHLNAAIFERAMRPLLVGHRLSTILFDDRGLVFAKSVAGAAEESGLAEINLASEASALLANPALVASQRKISAKDGSYLFSIFPAEEFIGFIEPVAGENWFLGVLRPAEMMPEQTRTFQAIFFVILLVAVSAVLWATARYARRVTVPLEQVTEATTKIARGEFDIGLRVATGDEVEAVATAVKQMAEDLKTYQAELVKSAKLATIGEMASEMSHEIQNRISGLSLWLQHLDAEVEADDPKREYLEEMKRGLQGFMALLAALKQFYRTPILDSSDADLNQLVQASLPYVQERVEARRINVELQLDSRLPVIQCDADKIKSVILNLLLNAVEAAGDGGRISVQTRVSDIRPQTSDLRPQGQRTAEKAVMLSVTDNGSGIAEEDLTRIFYPFYSTKAGGSGLGLAIASNLVAAHGGKIEVESRVGEGTTFTVILQTSDLRPQTSDLENSIKLV